MFPFLNEAGEGALDVPSVGHKAAWLRWLLSVGENVPAGFTIDVRSARCLVARDEACVRSLQEALDKLTLGSELTSCLSSCLAVRASPVHSLPGALLSVLDVPIHGEGLPLLARVLAAVDRVLASGDSAVARAHLAAYGVDPAAAPWVGLVVQRVVTAGGPPDFGAVLFTHDPASGEPGVFGEYALGQPIATVVGGRHRPEPVPRERARPGREHACLEVHQPRVFERLKALAARLAKAAGEPLELELMVAEEQLWLVQARPLLLSPRGLARVCAEALRMGLPKAERLLLRVSPRDIAALVELRLPEPALLPGVPVIACGLAASPGVVTGRLSFDMHATVAGPEQEPRVLLRRDALPEDVAAFQQAQAIVTTSGGLTSHAAVIARGLRIAAVVGCAGVRIDHAKGVLYEERGLESVPLAQASDLVTVDGYRGLVYAGRVEPVSVIAPELRLLYAELAKRRARKLYVLGPSPAAARAHEQCALDGVWDAATSQVMGEGSHTLATKIVCNFEADRDEVCGSPGAAIVCRVEEVASWALFLANEQKLSVT